jgi:cytoskeleton protein RodZ
MTTVPATAPTRQPAQPVKASPSRSRPRDERTVVAQPPPAPAATVGFVGSLQIDSIPPGARVFVNRKPVGVTPLFLTDVAAGSHAIRIEADRYAPWSSAIRVVADRQTDVRTTLSPSPDSPASH